MKKGIKGMTIKHFKMANTRRQPTLSQARHQMNTHEFNSYLQQSMIREAKKMTPEKARQQLSRLSMYDKDGNLKKED